jgi:Ca-activated chloride channel family protein
MKHKILFYYFILFFCTSCAEKNDPKVDELYLDFKAQTEIKAERFEEVLQLYLEMIEKNPNRASTHSNVGIIMSLLQKPDEALKSLSHALALAEKQRDERAKFMLNFNLGAVYANQKDIANAIKFYQAALDLVPSSIETKTNIELLMQEQKNEGKGDSNSQQQQNQQQNQGESKKNKDQNGDNQKENEPDKQNQDQQRQSSPRYKPRPFEGDQLSEGDVKKILGELRNQEQKIRANFDKKEKGNARDNEKDW